MPLPYSKPCHWSLYFKQGVALALLIYFLGMARKAQRFDSAAEGGWRTAWTLTTAVPQTVMATAGTSARAGVMRMETMALILMQRLRPLPGRSVSV